MISSVAAQLARAYGAIDRFLAAQLVEARRQVGASRAAQSVSAHETLTGTAIKAATQAATTAQELKRITPPAKVPLLDLGTARASDLQRATFPLVVPLVGAGSLVVAGPLTASLPIFSEALWLSTVASWPGALELIAFDPAMRGWFGPYSAAAQDHPTAQAQLAANGDQLADLLTQVETSAREVSALLAGPTDDLLSWRQRNRGAGPRFHLVAASDYPTGLDQATTRRLETLVASGPRLGVTVLLQIAPEQTEAVLERLAQREATQASILQTDGKNLWLAAVPRLQAPVPSFNIRPDLGQRLDELVCQAEAATRKPMAFAELEAPDVTWITGGNVTRTTAEGMVLAVGWDGNTTATMTLGDQSDPVFHTLITGQTRSGKSNLIQSLLHSLANRYGPDEVQLYLLDLKEGASFAPLRPSAASPDYLPHARLIGLKADPEFATAVLDYLYGEMRRRNALFREHGGSFITYRRAQPHAHMPRVLLVIDEFQKLMEGGGKAAAAAADRLAQFARESASSGIHVMLATQSLSGIGGPEFALKRTAIFDQFRARIALRNSEEGSEMTLERGNKAAAALTGQGRAVVNLDSGRLSANTIVQIPRCQETEDNLAARRSAWVTRVDSSRFPPPLVFDGESAPTLLDALDGIRHLRQNRRTAKAPPKALLGRSLELERAAADASRPQLVDAVFELLPRPGRTLAILGGSGGKDRLTGEQLPHLALGSLQAVGLSLALQHPDGDAEFTALDFLGGDTTERDSFTQWLTLMEELGHPVEVIGPDQAAAYLEAAAAALPTRDGASPRGYLLGFGLDRAPYPPAGLGAMNLGPVGHLRELMRQGPVSGLFTLAWWGAPDRYLNDIGQGPNGVSVDGVLGLILAKPAFSAQYGHQTEYLSRPGRGVFVDRTQAPEPQVILPFAPLTRPVRARLKRVDWEGT